MQYSDLVIHNTKSNKKRGSVRRYWNRGAYKAFFVLKIGNIQGVYSPQERALALLESHPRCLVEEPCLQVLGDLSIPSHGGV